MHRTRRQYDKSHRFLFTPPPCRYDNSQEGLHPLWLNLAQLESKPSKTRGRRRAGFEEEREGVRERESMREKVMEIKVKYLDVEV